VRLLGATLGAVVLIVVAAAACGSDDDAAANATLAPIITTTTVPTTIASTTTQPRFYKIQQGDTLGKIAAAFGLPIQAIMEKNQITDANKIYAGQILELPVASEIVVTSLPAVTTAVGATAAPAITTASPVPTTVAP
jgi:peptidoglycan DL-endopeptidase CwlO